MLKLLPIMISKYWLLLLLPALGLFLFWQIVLFDSSGYNLDGANYYFESVLFSKGFKPYLDFVENKNPGLFFLLYPISLLFKWNIIGAIGFFVLLNLANLVLMYYLISEITQSKKVKILSMTTLTLSYCLIISLAGGAFIVPQIPQLTVTLLAFILFFRKRYLFSGVCLALAFLFRQNALTDLMVLSLFLGLLLYFRLEKNWGPYIKLVLGFILTLLPPLLLIIVNGSANEIYEYAYFYNFQLLDDQSIWQKIIGFLLLNFQLYPSYIFVLIWAGLAIFIPLNLKRETKQKKAVFALLGLLFVFGSTGIMSYKIASFYHLIQIFHLYALSLVLMAEPVVKFIESIKPKIEKLILGSGLVFLFLAFVTPLVVMLTDRSISAIDRMAQTSPENKIGRWIKANSNSEETILVWGIDSEIYLTAERFPASRFQYNHHLTGISHVLPEWQRWHNLFIEDLGNKKPRYIIVESKYCFCGRCSSLQEYFPEFQAQYRKSTGISEKDFEIYERI